MISNTSLSILRHRKSEIGRPYVAAGPFHTLMNENESAAAGVGGVDEGLETWIHLLGPTRPLPQLRWKRPIPAKLEKAIAPPPPAPRGPSRFPARHLPPS